MTSELRVLVVEDSDDDFELVLHALRAGPWHLTCARVDTEARLRESLTAERWNVVLADYTLPTLDAVRTMEVLAELSPSTPLIVVSGTVGEDVAVKTLQLGADDYLLKQSLTRLVPAIERALDRAATREHRTLLETRLREERDYNAAVLDALPGVLYHIDCNARLLRWNQNLERVSGYSASELAAMQAFDLFAPEDRDGVAAALADVAAGDRGEIEATFVARDGARATYLFTGVPLDTLGDGGVVGVGIDISEREQARADLVALNAVLEQRVAERTEELRLANAELDSFAHTVSHDLRTPLNGIFGFTQLLTLDYGHLLSGPGKQYLDGLTTASQRMNELIEDLLKLSQASRDAIRWEPVNLSAIATGVAERLQASSPDRAVTVTIDDGLTAEGDVRLLQIVLENLIQNAWKYTSKQAAAEIRISAVPGRDQPTFAVSDNGAGFDMRHAPRLFRPFERLHDPGEFPGTGVGLATVDRIIARHGGHIAAESAPEQGATFTFTLGTPGTSPA